jgi:hypothetical protein
VGVAGALGLVLRLDLFVVQQDLDLRGHVEEDAANKCQSDGSQFFST